MLRYVVVVSVCLAGLASYFIMINDALDDPDEMLTFLFQFFFYIFIQLQVCSDVILRLTFAIWSNQMVTRLTGLVFKATRKPKDPGHLLIILTERVRTQSSLNLIHTQSSFN